LLERIDRSDDATHSVAHAAGHVHSITVPNVPDEPRIVEVDPRDPHARGALVQYLNEILDRVAGITGVHPEQADDVDDYRPPGGCFLLVYRGDAVAGCGALRTMDAQTGEIKRMWIHPTARGSGLGSLLLDALIARSRASGHRRVVLDTNGVLVEALALYAKHGFLPIERYNDNPDATHFLGLRL
jgi:GNAT superfamily N-acetyltransferase